MCEGDCVLEDEEKYDEDIGSEKVYKEEYEMLLLLDDDNDNDIDEDKNVEDEDGRKFGYGSEDDE